MHGWHARNVEKPQTAAMQLGDGVHNILSGVKRVVPYPGSVRRGKEWDQFQADHAGEIILTAADFDRALAMATAIQSCDAAKRLLEGEWEKTHLFRWMGLDCRVTPDVRGTSFLTEIKTSASSEPVKFTYHALRMAYHAQMRFQQIGTKDDVPCFIVCCEATEPYPVTVFEMDKRALELGEKLLTLWGERLKSSEASGQFPPYCQSIFPLVAPEEIEYEYGEAA
jgi:hypothetical protein